MAWSIVGVSAVVEVTAASHTLTEPAGVAAGDLLVACISSRIASTTSITLPTGGAWTLVGEQKNNSTVTTSSALPSAMMAYAVRGASAPNLTFTHPVAPSVAIGRVIAYRGGATVSPRDGAAAAATTATNVTAVSVAGLTTTQADDLIVAMTAGGQEAAWVSFNATTPSGASGATDITTAPSATWRERADSVTTTGADTSLGIFDALKTAAGATGNLTVTASVAAGHSVVAGAFKILPVVNVSVSVTGQEVTASAGTATATAAVSTLVPVTGLETTVSIGPPPQSIAFASGGALGATFVSGTTNRQYMGPAGYVAEAGIAVSVVSVVITEGAVNVSVPVTGQELAASVGTATVGAIVSVSIPVTGQSTTALVGDVSVFAGISIAASVSGQSLAISLGPPLQPRNYAAAGPLGAGFVSEISVRQYMGTAGYIAETASADVVSVVVTEGAEGLIGVWDGSAWVDKPAKVWTGSSWTQKPVRHWNGSAWV